MPVGDWWVLIPILAILSGTLRKVVSSWLRLKASQQALGSSTRELEQEVVALRQGRAELIDRLQNLEAIVVSQTWTALQEKGLSPAEQEMKVAAAVRREIAPPEPAAVNRQRIEQIAQRLR